MKQIDRFTESVSGVIIGGDYLACGLYYDGRCQGGQFYAKDEDDAKAVGEGILQRIKQSTGSAYDLIYPKKDAWEVRIR